MFAPAHLRALVATALTLCCASGALRGQTPQRGAAPAPLPAPTRADILRGEYSELRANNDLLSYHLDIRVDPVKKFISGKNTIKLRMLKPATRIQLDLYANLNVDKILFADTTLKYTRELNTVFVDFPTTLKPGQLVVIDFYYSGTPTQNGRFGGFTFSQDPAGRPWIFTACEGQGAAIWWPNKDQWRDEVEDMEISVAIPSDLVDVSNGRFEKTTDLGDGYTRWDWMVHYPINNYDVSLNIGKYEHFGDKLGDLTMDFYALPEDLDKAKSQFAQAKGMIQAYTHYFGEYPFIKDGYKLVEVPYSGMEHQSAVTYGNGFHNGYGRPPYDWTGVGISTKFDFIIIHESGHEWFGNAVSAADVSDMWIHEGWTTYLECLYVEYTYGKEDYVKYVNGYKSHVRNDRPIITEHGIHREPPQDMYFKGALFLHTLRNIANDDRKFLNAIYDFFQTFKYKNIMTEDVVAFFNKRLGRDLTPVFNQYLRHTALPVLELQFDDANHAVMYRWKADEPNFAMPVRVRQNGQSQMIEATQQWKTMKTTVGKDQFEVVTDEFFVDVSKQ
jgi:aminopeptidase N